MMRNNFRKHKPVRTCTKKYANYRSYKKFLIEDFNSRCGYCDDHDFWSGGSHNYHIDHFAPKSLFPEVKTEYDNLVYSCPYCNNSKSDDWPSDSKDIPVIDDRGYIDPCSSDYSVGFYRNKQGEIIPANKTSEYMYNQLKLYLKRHSIIYNLNRLHELLDKIEDTINSKDIDKPSFDKLKDVYFELSREFHTYIKYLMGEQINA